MPSAPFDPCPRHFGNLSSGLRRNGVLAGDCFERPEPLIWLALELLQDQWHGLRPHADNALVWIEKNDVSRVRQIAGLVLPLLRELGESLPNISFVFLLDRCLRVFQRPANRGRNILL